MILVKSELCSTVGDERLSHLMLMTGERNIEKDLNLQMFVDTFALIRRKL